MSYSGSRYDPTDLVPPPGALPPVIPESWLRAAREAGLQTAEPRTSDSVYREESAFAEPDYFESPVEESESRKSRRRQSMQSGKNGGAH